MPRIPVAMVLVCTLLAASCGGGGGDDITVVYVTDGALLGVRSALDGYAASNPGIEFDIVTGPSDELLAMVADGEVELYIDEEAYVAEASSDGRYQRAVALGRDPLVLAVAKGNPLAVAGLQVLADPTVRSGLCSDDELCGRLALEVLASAGVEPVTDLRTEPRTLVDSVATGELDAALVLRTESRLGLGDLQLVPLPPEHLVEQLYDIGVFGSDPAARSFAHWVETSDAAQHTLSVAGLRNLLEIGQG